ncbi:MAG TPA: septal ring lytic transglycosylase RlpA family protein [Allosphingosinicella sp.]|jgi:rare lipoprotein A|nr:septal ring lytic transglycosylase RlpA family protein [Allosphingosinicella sp.]
MLFSRLRRRGTQFAVLVAITGLMSSGPAQADEVAAGDRIESLTAVVATLDESLRVADPVAAEAKVWKAIGQGTASYYGRELAGNRTASGERFDPQGFTAAHRTLPLGTRIRVTNVANGRSVIVRVNDRGPFVGRRLIDVSLGAAREIEMVRSGTAQVRLEMLPTT